MPMKRLSLFASLTTMVLISPLLAQEDTPKNEEVKQAPAEKKKKRTRKAPIAALDYAQWERLDSTNHRLSADGKWLVYGVTRVDKKRDLHLLQLKGKKEPKVASFPQGERPLFSNDSQWLAVTIGEKPDDSKEQPPDQSGVIHLRRLADEKTTEFKKVRGLVFSEDSNFIALEITDDSADKNALVVRNLKDDIDTVFGNVTRFSWSDRGSHLAMVIDSPGISNSLQLFNPQTGSLQTLESSDQEYTALAWRRNALDLIAMREIPHAEKEDTSHVLLAWRNLGKGRDTKKAYDHRRDKDFPKDLFITSGGLAWSHDGQSVYCDLQKWKTKPKSLQKEKTPSPKKDETKPKEASMNEPSSFSLFENKAPETLREKTKGQSNVEVWHSKDTDIMPRQKRLASSLKNPKRRAVWWPKQDDFVQLSSELTERISVTRDGDSAIGYDRTPHERTAMFGPRLQDIYSIDTKTGKRKLILDKIKYPLSASPDGHYLLFQRESDIHSYDLRTGQQINLTKDLEVPFTNQEDDTLATEKPPYGMGSWLKDNSGVVLSDRFNLWLIAPDGSSTRQLTNGKDGMIRHRLSQASFQEESEGLIDPKRPLYVALHGELTKKSGYAKLPPLAKKGELKTLIWEDKSVMSLTRARDAKTFFFTKEATNDSPDLFVAGPELAKPRQVSKTNPFQKKYHWGHSELVDFENEHGVKLQGSLRYPANYKPGNKYPMIVYIYEKRSQELHRYTVPTEEHPYNPAVFSAQGYFVFQPDIVYRPQEPGVSALECVVPAVHEVLKTGMIDKNKIGLVGHSWGAYQTAYIVTRSDIFAAGVAGAPLTNMMSMSVSVYWNSGQTNAAIFTQSQGRMNTPFWRDVETYVRNSPIHGLDTLNTPLLIAFGDKDGAVDWGQGVQMYNAARWAKKDNMVMLVYPGENHGLRKPENRVDYHYRVLEWFQTHVKGDKAPKWITEGKSYLERQREKEDTKDKKSDPKKLETSEKAPPKKTIPIGENKERRKGKEKGKEKKKAAAS
ncbi:MAG: dipeptidyl aminopeptidase/acylaminoacyl peptidase [Akkermansiaceae bacterium]|jgi:dipeptidyl aminopeptidase/acylaminoacyl peptidase